jgi:hypothetical protein
MVEDDGLSVYPYLMLLILRILHNVLSPKVLDISVLRCPGVTLCSHNVRFFHFCRVQHCAGTTQSTGHEHMYVSPGALL